MLPRSLLGAATVALIGLPYVLSTSDKSDKGSANHEKAGGQSQLQDVLDSADVSATQPFLASSGSGELQVTGLPVRGFEEILRFDVTPAWVLSRWPRVSTTTNQSELKGYRVPVATGARAQDLAGSLTYFFNAKQELQRIVLHGTTGDPEPLAQFVTTKFNFRRAKDQDAGWQRYQVQWHGKPVSELRVRPAPIAESTQPHRRYLVNLLIERPQRLQWFTDGERKLSDLRL